MAKPLPIDPAVLKRVKDLPKSDKADCLDALCGLVAAFGQPHAHQGIGIRKLGGNLFECRAGLARRFVFLNKPEALFVFFIGNHDEVRALLKNENRR